MPFRSIVVLVLSTIGMACATSPDTHEPHEDLGLLWVKHATEYQAVSRQVYQAASTALPGFVDDRSWTVVPGNPDVRDLPPAVILDVDETVISNIDFQMGHEPPVTQRKLDAWNRAHVARPVPGVVDFVRSARAAGVTVFFVTNRPCERVPEFASDCPYRDTIVADLQEIGLETDPRYVLLARERGWNREKLTRRQHIALTHRIIMLIGDDLGDFVPCVRTKVYPPCAKPATAASRQRLLEDNVRFWGHGWYVLPNPMHGSWTSQLP